MVYGLRKNEEIYRITENVEYDIIDKRNKIIIGTFKTHDDAEGFLIESPQYRSAGTEIVPTLTHRDIHSMNYLMKCMSDIYSTNKKIWFDNEILDKIAREFIEKIDDIRSNKSVIGYI